MLRIAIVSLLLWFTISISTVFSQDAPCGGCGSLLESRLEALRLTDVWYTSARDSLVDTSSQDWTEGEILDYLEVALLRIYTATNIYTQQAPVGEIDPAGFVSMHCLDEWPGNPLNNWEPIRIVEPSAGYAPGDISYEICPFSHSTNGYQLSYQYYIYGPDIDCVLPEAHGRNSEWAAVPKGTAFTLGVIYQTDEEIEKTQRLLAFLAAELEEQNRADVVEQPGEATNE